MNKSQMMDPLADVFGFWMFLVCFHSALRQFGKGMLEAEPWIT